MTSEHERIAEATRDFTVSVADTPAALEAAYRLRHQVYRVERGYEPGQGTLETDGFDAQAGHVLLTQRSTGCVVGTVRVIRSGGEGLPMQRLCGPSLSRVVPPSGGTGEIGRFAISKDLRDVGCSGDVLVRLGLMRGVVDISGRTGLTHWCAVMEPALLRRLRVSGIHFQPLGPAIEHRGLRQPSWGAIGRVLAGIRRERPAVWDYITEGGALWRENAAAAA